MSDHSNIEWTDATWNPLVGCSRVSAGCVNCYAERVAHRFAGVPDSIYFGTTRKVNGHPAWNGTVRFNERALDQPLRWKRPRRIFVNSMSDLFHESVPDEWIDRVFAVMALARQHTFQVLTKRPKRMRDYLQRRTAELAADWIGSPISLALVAESRRRGDPLPWNARLELLDNDDGWRADPDRIRRTPGWPLRHVWLGVSVEDQATADERIPLLLATPAAVRFLSIEPMLGPIDLTVDGLVCLPCPNAEQVVMDPTTGAYECCRACDFTGIGSEWGIDWVIAGGESGPHARPSHPDWFRTLRDQCAAAAVPFLFKQWGEYASVSDVAGQGAHHTFPDGSTVRRVGKKAAGRLLDGTEHNAFPRSA